MEPISRIKFFSLDEIDVMRERVFDLLGRRGVKMDHPEVLKILDKAGAEVNFENKIVRFRKKFLEEVLKKAPKQLALAGLSEGNDLEIPRRDGTFHLRTGTGARCYLDPESGVYRKTTISDVATWAKIVNELDEVSFCAFPFPTDVPVETADIHALRTMLLNSRKHIWVQPYSAGSINYLIELATVAAGGGSDAEEPTVS